MIRKNAEEAKKTAAQKGQNNDEEVEEAEGARTDQVKPESAMPAGCELLSLVEQTLHLFLRPGSHTDK
eukprot:4462137-Pleurochrysis_carterae.AAC.4